MGCVGRYSRLARCESRATGRWTRQREPRRARIPTSIIVVAGSRFRPPTVGAVARRYSTSVTIGHGAYFAPNVRLSDLCATWRVYIYYICAVVVITAYRKHVTHRTLQATTANHELEVPNRTGTYTIPLCPWQFTKHARPHFSLDI